MNKCSDLYSGEWNFDKWIEFVWLVEYFDVDHQYRFVFLVNNQLNLDYFLYEKDLQFNRWWRSSSKIYLSRLVQLIFELSWDLLRISKEIFNWCKNVVNEQECRLSCWKRERRTNSSGMFKTFHWCEIQRSLEMIIDLWDNRSLFRSREMLTKIWIIRIKMRSLFVNEQSEDFIDEWSQWILLENIV